VLLLLLLLLGRFTHQVGLVHRHITFLGMLSCYVLT
jgi:hypothetical protein